MNNQQYYILAEKVKSEVDKSFLQKNNYFLVTAKKSNDDDESTTLINNLFNSVNVANHYPSTVSNNQDTLAELQKKQILFSITKTSLDVKFGKGKMSIKLDIYLKFYATKVTQKLSIKVKKKLSVEENTNDILRNLVELLILV